MKKLLLVAAIGVAGVLSASPSIPASASVSLQPQCFVTYTSCGVAAMTTQDWTDEQAFAWADLVEDIYCNPNYLLHLDDGIDWNGL